MKNGEAEGREPVTAIVLHRALRQLIGPTGTVVDLPWLTMQLLIALHDHAPQFVDARRLQELVWPDTHISPDALKQRVRLARQALREAGYDPALLDSVRGEGYALRVPLAEPAIGHAPQAAEEDTAPTPAEAAGQPGLSPGMRQHASHVSSTYQSSWWRRWRIAIMAALIFSAALIAERLGQWGGSTRTVDAPANAVIGPVPVRVALLRDTATDSLVSRALEAVMQSARRTLAAHADVLLVPRPAGASCTDGPPVHLCAHIAGNAQEVRLDVTDLRSGTALVLGSWPLSASEGDVLAGGAEAAQLAVLVSPGTLRWIGEPAGRGDREFGTLLRAVKASTSCDRVAWRDAVRDLGTTAERAPQFHVARALRALLAVASTDLPGQIPTAALADVEQLMRVDPEQMLAQAARWLAAVRQLPPSEVSTAAEAELSAEFRRIKRQSPGVAWLAEHLRSCSLKAAVTQPGDPE
ncbi:MAG: helix-turn-helix domain-containing protein [Gemmatimonadaceae bacterium]|nr:helix-turn-helix domain-containing protein [Gemmatimonadaceae bacterium]